MLCYAVAVLLAITAPAVNERGPRYMQAVFAALRQSLGRGEVLQLNYATHTGQVGLFCRVPDSPHQEVMQLIQAKYPNCSLTVLDEMHLDPLP